MRCPKCGGKANWYRYLKTTDGIFVEKWNGSYWENVEDPEEFEERFKKAISNHTYGTGEAFLLIHDCGYVLEEE